MIQVLTPHSFIRGSYLLKESYVRFSPKRGEIIISPELLSLLKFKKGGTVNFAIDSHSNAMYIMLDDTGQGFKVNMDKGRGRIYSVSIFKLLERMIGTTIIDPISIGVESLPTIKNEVRLYKLFTDDFKQVETVLDEDSPITWYKGKAYNKKTWLAKLRAYWERSSTSVKALTRERNKRRYDEMKAHSTMQELDIDFVDIEKSPL